MASPVERETLRAIEADLKAISRCLDSPPSSGMGLAYSIEGLLEDALLLTQELMEGR